MRLRVSEPTLGNETLATTREGPYSKSSPWMLTGRQCRSARTWLGLTHEEFATAAGVSKRTVASFENGIRPTSDNSRARIHDALVALKVRPLFDEDGEAVGIGSTNALFYRTTPQAGE